MLSFIKNKLCCCLFPPNYYSRLSTEESDDMFYDYTELNVIEQTKNSIITHLKNQNIIELSNCEPSQLYNIINNLSDQKIKSLNLNDEFIIKLYSNILNQNSKEQNLISNIFKKLITLNLFYNSNISDSIIHFLKNNIWLFDHKLWLHLTLDPNNLDDQLIIDKIIKLNDSQILHLFKPIEFYNYTFTTFELIILGKLELINDKLQHVRFFNLESIINLIKKTNASLYFNEQLLSILNEIKKKNNIDQKYLDCVLELLTKRFYLIN